jgi:hypothetical protein
MLLRTFLALFVVAGTWAQQTRPAKSPQKRDEPLTRSSFSAKGLDHEDDLTDFFVGNFADVPFDRGSMGFSVLFEQYMEAYARRCDAYLPANKVEMTRQVCADPPPLPPRPGDPPPLPGTSSCSTWRTVSLGYADPVLYAAKAQLDKEQTANLVKDILGSKNLMGSAKDAFQLTGDLDALVRLNACDGAGLRRFQENVVLFSKGKQPMLLPGAPPPVTPIAQPAGVLADSDYNRLVEDLVADQAKTWAFNRFVPGSTSRVIVAHDPTGRPAKILAKYFFNSPGRSDRTQGSVTVSFSDEKPECIYFSDAPNACQTPSRRIVSKYSSGGYLDPSALPHDSSPAAAAPVQPPPDRAAQAKAQAEASVRGSVCVPDDLLADWRNPPPGSKMEALQRTLQASLRERAKIRTYDQTKWMTVDSRIYSTWNPAGPFRGVVTATDGGSCAVGHHEFLALAP